MPTSRRSPSRRSPARATVKSISEAAGVAPSTVSRALNDDPRISAKTRQLIANIARTAHYVPNGHARSLITRRSGVIALMVGELTNPFYPELMRLLTRRTSERGLQLMLLPIGPGEFDAAMLRTMREYGVDGCIVAAATLSTRAADALAEIGVPTVMLNRSGRGHASAVWCNNEAGGAAIAHYLYAQGHRRVGYVAGRNETSDRERGLRRGLAEFGLSLARREVGNYTHDAGAEIGARLAAEGFGVDAIVGANDIIALGVIDGIRRAGARVPEDVSVMGFDDIEIASWASYALTTIAQPMPLMVERALDLIVARIADPSLPAEEIYLQGSLRLRGSVRAIAMAGA
jgi:DNA-binding LacI/PurR family transcriptional regulator